MLKILTTLLLLFGSLNAATFNVSTTAEFRQALSDAAQNGEDDTIVLADGVYKTTDDGGGTFTFFDNEDKDLYILGTSQENTILSGDNQNQVLKILDSGYDTILRLEYMTIKDGYTLESGAGVWSDYTTKTKYLTVTNNISKEGWGGGLFLASRSGGARHIVDNTQITYNKVERYAREGAGIYGYSIEISNSNISYNTNVRYDGGGASNIISIKNSVISHNTAHRVAAVEGAGSITNCLIYNNNSTDTSGEYYSDAVVSLTGMPKGYMVNSLMINNSGGLYGGSHVVNSTFLNNRDIDITGGSTSTITISNTFINENNIKINYFGSNLMFTAEPGFVDDTNDNYHLQADSVLIDAGINSYEGGYGQEIIPATDLDGNPRPIGCSTDIGPYEYQSALICPAEPNIPTNLTASDGTYTDKIVLNWNSTEDTINYEVYRSSTNSYDGSTKLSVSAANTYIDTAMSLGEDFYYFVKACNDIGCSAYSASAKGSTPPEVVIPIAPVTITASQGTHEDKVAVSFSAVANADSYELYRYEVVQVSGKAVNRGDKIATLTTTAYDDTSVTAGTVYQYSVKACNSAGCGNYSDQVSGWAEIALVVPTAPTGVSASDGEFNDRVNILWSATDNTDHYSIYRSTTLGSEGTKLEESIDPSFVDTTLTSGVTYYYGVKSCNDAGCSTLSAQDSGYSEEVVNPPAVLPPSDISASQGTYADKVELQWTKVGSSTEYQIKRTSTQEGGEYNANINYVSTGNQIYFTDSFATLDVVYNYTVRTVLGSQVSEYSNPASGYAETKITIPDAPTNMIASNGTYENKIQVSWSDPNGATRYELYRSESASVDGSKLADTNNALYDDTTMTQGTTYYYRVKACNSKGCSDNSAIASGYAETPLAIPSVPTGLSASQGAHTNKIVVIWSDVADTDYYEVYRSDVAGVTGSKQATEDSFIYDDLTITDGRTYYYTVNACNEKGCSALSAQVSGYATAEPLSPPNTITVSKGTHAAYIQINFSNVPDANHFELYRTHSIIEDAVGMKIADLTTNKYYDRDVIVNQTYLYHVRSCDLDGCSAYGSYDYGFLKVDKDKQKENIQNATSSVELKKSQNEVLGQLNGYFVKGK